MAFAKTLKYFECFESRWFGICGTGGRSFLWWFYAAIAAKYQCAKNCQGCLASDAKRFGHGLGYRWSSQAVPVRRSRLHGDFWTAAFEGLPGSAEPFCFATQTAWKIQKPGEQAWECWCHACVRAASVWISVGRGPRFGGFDNAAPISGLRNLGNSCWLNSVLQCFLHCGPLARDLLDQTCEKGPLRHWLTATLVKLRSRDFDYVAPFELLHQMYSTRADLFRAGDNADAADAVALLLE